MIYSRLQFYNSNKEQMYKNYLLCIIAMTSLISLPICDNTSAVNFSSDMNDTFVAKGRISGLVYTTAEKNTRTIEARVTPPDILLGTWYWKVEHGTTIDFKANISKVSTLGTYSQLIQILNFKTMIHGIFSYNYIQVRGTGDARLYINGVLEHNYINTSITVEPHLGKVLKTVKITIEDPQLKNDIFKQKPIYGVADYYFRLQ
jgi:hypothetical protein